MKNSKLKIDIKFSIPKSENIPNLKLDFKNISTQEDLQSKLNAFQSVVKKSSPVKLPIFSNSFHIPDIKFIPSTIASLSTTTGGGGIWEKGLAVVESLSEHLYLEEELNKELNRQEDYDTTLPRTEIISLIDFYPLYDNNSALTKAGDHFRYQLLYLNANRFIINNDIKRYFSGSIKDESLRIELQSLLRLINNKTYQKNDFELYTNNYFDKLIEVSDYSISQILNFYSKLDNITNVFIEKNKPISLLRNSNFTIPNTASIQKIYGTLFLSLEQKISLYSRKIFNNQDTVDINKIATNIENETEYYFKYSDPTKFKNLKINESKFDLKMIFEQSTTKRILSILDFIVYESYKNTNKEFISTQLDGSNSYIRSLDLSFKNEDFTKGRLLTLLSKYSSIPNDNNKERYLFNNLQSETYISNVFQNIVSSNFSEDSVELIGNEINISDDIKGKNSEINSVINNLVPRAINPIISTLENSDKPPYLKLFLRNISKNLKNYNFEKYSKNLESIITNVKDLVAFYYKQVETCKNAPPTYWDEIDSHPAGTWHHVIGNRGENNKLIKHVSTALRNIHVEWAAWDREGQVSKYYVPYGDGNEDVANFIGFLTYIFKRTSDYPGQYSRDNTVSYYTKKQHPHNEHLSFIASGADNLSQSYWLTFNELIKSINQPDDDFSSLKNPFYKKFSECYINILKSLGINDLSYNDYSYESTINVNNEQIFIMFNIFIFLVDNIKSLFNFVATIHWFLNYEDGENADRNFYKITNSKNSIGGGLFGYNGWGDLWFPTLECVDFPLDRHPFIYSENYISWRTAGEHQYFNALDIKFDIVDQIKEFNTTSTLWLKDFNSIKETYNFINQNINNVIISINEILSINYDVLRYFIDPKFVFNKRNFFMTRFQLSDLKNKYSKIKNKNINYLIDNIYDDTYESNITKVLLNFKDSSKNAKILTFGVPIQNIGVSDQIDVIIYRKNLVHQNLNFKPIIKTFNLNLFCTLTDFFGKKDPLRGFDDYYDHLTNSDFYYHKNDLNFNKLTNQELLNLNRGLVLNHFYSEILNQYTKIMTGIEINDFTLIKDYPIIDSGQILTNISNIIFNDIQKQEGTERLLSIKNNITKFTSPLEFRSFLFSSCLFDRIFSTLIDPDDFEIDPENWIKRNLIPTTWINEQPIDLFNPGLLLTIDNVPVILRNGKYYLNDINNIENVADSYKVKIDKR